MVRHLLTLKEFSGREMEELIDKAIEIKKNPAPWSKTLDNKSMLMLFQKTSTRTRLSFEAGMTQLGGHAIFSDWKTTNFILADIADETRCVDRYCDVIMARMIKFEDLARMAEVSSVPVINGCCQRYHPCQSMADLMTVKEYAGGFRGKKMVYIGIANNVSNTLTLACVRLGMRITLVTPIKHEPAYDPEIIEEAKASGLYEETLDIRAALADADFVYTDTWIDMELFSNPDFAEEKERRIKLMMPYQVTPELLGDRDIKIMHCLPAHRGYEISGEAVEDRRSIMFDQAENRMHAQKAIILRLLGKL